jgi:hypothetical protein
MTNETRELDDCELDAVVGGLLAHALATAAQQMSFMMAAADAVVKAIGERN